MDPGDPSPLFEDTSAGVNKHDHSGVGKGPDVYPGQALLSDPMSNLAMAYGSSLASHGKEMMDKNVCDSCQTMSINDDGLDVCLLWCRRACDVHCCVETTPILFSLQRRSESALQL